MLRTLTTLDDTTPDALRPVLRPLPPLTEAGTRLLDAASDLFYLRGVRAVGVDLIAETAGTTKKTLYDRFGSKDALVALYLLRRAHRWRAYLLSRLAEAEAEAEADSDGDNDGDQAVLLVFDALETWMGPQRRGCAFVNAHAELGDGDHPAVPVIRAEKAWTRALFDTLTGDPDRGAHLHLLYEGALVVLTAGANPAAVTEARRSVRTALTRT
ncbi:helix-turn-helix domain-containing protein [Umezawaea sp. Da 62-37]|uniref:TetR/AcrR family transcriptional regulator n=1 Tax=Umezawaea sp. Da 62-37 TaxID=3075927 RepID=UPI0028F74976|nr:helix-turn-helix domain-containing protein [Umezawaea sp. Da 62-37]WNV90728.1 helix-turn-helix domain-containing protein [Umezawaea sp. Da 62-37]